MNKPNKPRSEICADVALGLLVRAHRAIREMGEHLEREGKPTTPAILANNCVMKAMGKMSEEIP